MRTHATKQPKPTERNSTHKTPVRTTPTNGRSLSTGSTMLQRKPGCPCGGGCPRCQEKGLLQTKLKIGEPGDKYEQEADRVADEVMRMPEPAVQRQIEPEEEEEEEIVQTKSITDRVAPLAQRRETSEAPTIMHPVFTLPGQPLTPETCTFMESRFGRDFSRVRVHTNTLAAQSANSLGARAYTVGHNIVFDQGQYAPATTNGKRLLAHELTHVMQQQSGDVSHVLQPSLFVTGIKTDIQAFLTTLEKASGFTLSHSLKTNKVSIAASSGEPQSPVLANQLRIIINNNKQNAEINLVDPSREPRPGKFGISIGAFPSDLSNLVQQVRMDHILSLEKGAPGSGVPLLMHEIVENYHAHALVKDEDLEWTDLFLLSHEEALKTENLVRGELGYPGSRDADFPVAVPGKEGISWITDLENYFLVYEKAEDVISNVRRVERVNVSSYTIDIPPKPNTLLKESAEDKKEGLPANYARLPKKSEKSVAAVATDLTKYPTASAIVEGSTTNETTFEGQTRAIRFMNAVVERVDNSALVSWRRFVIKGSKGTQERVVITVDRPSNKPYEVKSKVKPDREKETRRKTELEKETSKTDYEAVPKLTLTLGDENKPGFEAEFRAVLPFLLEGKLRPFVLGGVGTGGFSAGGGARIEPVMDMPLFLSGKVAIRTESFKVIEYGGGLETGWVVDESRTLRLGIGWDVWQRWNADEKRNHLLNVFLSKQF